MFTTRPQLIGTFGAVASTHWLASSAGMAVLECGGNAFDAAVAAGFVLQVAEPHMNGPAGDVPIIAYCAGERRVRVLCGQGVAPKLATSKYFRNLGINMIPGTGLLASVVPGAFDAWLLLLRDYGTMKLAEVAKFAIGYAQNGVPVTDSVHSTIKQVANLFETEWLTSASIYLPFGKAPKKGKLFSNLSLTKFWLRVLEIAAEASDDRVEQIEAARLAWSEGFVAEAVDSFCRKEAILDSSGGRHHGLLTGDDLARWHASWEDPVYFDYHGYRVFKTGPWGQGPVLLQQLALLRNFDVFGMDPHGSEFVHTVAECAKLAFADREAWYGDPDFTDVPMEVLLSSSYNYERSLLVTDVASQELRPGTARGQATIPSYGVQGDDLLALGGVGEPTLGLQGEWPGDTCHLDVIDEKGNMVSATPSGGWLQSSPVIPELGFPLGTRAQMFCLEEGLANCIKPGKRPRTTLTPSFLMRNGEPYMSLGTPGGDQQDQWQLIFLLRHIHHSMNLQEAIDAPSFHSEHFPSSFFPHSFSLGRLVMEGRFGKGTFDEVQKKGHSISRVSDWSEGRLSAATWVDGIISAGANPRGMQGYAVLR